MLAFAITVLFTLAGIVSVATIVHCLIGARAAYAQLMREGEAMRAALEREAAARMQPRPAPRAALRSVTPRRRPVALRPLAHQVCAAA